MSSRHRRRLAITLLATVSLAMFVVAVVVGGGAAYAKSRIRPGMARAEVEARFGPPDGNVLAVGATPVAHTTLVWKDRGLVVEFDETDCVRTVARPPSLVETVRSSLGL